MNRSRLSALALGLVLSTACLGATFPYFGPVSGVLKGSASSPITTAAAYTDIVAMWTSCSSPATKVLMADGNCAVPASVTPAALTKADDTNVTLTLGGTPATALLQATSITAGWTGTLAASRGGLGMSTVTDDTVAVANGSAWQSKALTDCDGATNAVTYDTTTNAWGCNTITGATFANPSASLGLSAINGVATTAMRSDAAPALSQSISPTMTGTWQFAQPGKFSIGGAAISNSAVTVVTDSQTPNSGGTAGPLINMVASRAAVQGLWMQNKSTATNATNYGWEIANDTVGKELFGFNTSTTYTGPWGAGIPSGQTLGLDVPTTSAGTLTIATNSHNRFGVDLATGNQTIGNTTDNATTTIAGSGAVSIGGTTTFTKVANPSVVLSPASGGSYLQVNRASSGTGEVGFQIATAGAQDWYIYESPSSSTLNLYGAGAGDNMHLAGAGGMYMHGATGSSQGAGTINATGLYINGVPASGGVTTTGSFIATATGFTAGVTCTLKYRLTGSTVFLYAGTACLGTSNTTAFTMTGLPTAVRPARAVSCLTTGSEDNTQVQLGSTDIGGGVTAGTLQMNRNINSGGVIIATSSWTASGTKGATSTWSCIYDIDS